MDPITSNAQILGKNKNQELILKYNLSSVPTERWVLFFNKRSSKYSMRVVILENTAYILVVGKESILKTNNIIDYINEFINVINKEEIVSSVKEQILLDNYTPGMVIVHDSLLDINNVDLYRNYINTIRSRIYT